LRNGWTHEEVLHRDLALRGPKLRVVAGCGELPLEGVDLLRLRSQLPILGLGRIPVGLDQVQLQLRGLQLLPQLSDDAGVLVTFSSAAGRSRTGCHIIMAATSVAAAAAAAAEQTRLNLGLGSHQLLGLSL
jgi:hypothetical protein